MSVDAAVESLREWVAESRATNSYRVERIALADVPRWHSDPTTGNISHDSGQFFSIRGLELCSASVAALNWAQPIVDQPETGVLGLLCRRSQRGGHEFLLQAKMEPGNVNLVQLSPTLQATYSNYTRVHGGRTPDYLERFLAPHPDEVLADTLQPETGARFWHKQNRNMVLEVEPNLEVAGGFRWVHQHVLDRLLGEDDLVNMDARSVLSTFPNHVGRPTDHIESAIRARRDLDVDRSRVALNRVSGWVVDDHSVRHESGQYFEVVGVGVEAAEREVASWGQPLLLHTGLGLAALFSRSEAGARRYLFQAKFEPGNRHLVELAPTVSVFDYRARFADGVEVPYLREFMELSPDTVLSSTIQSEEGGRFWNLRNRYVIADVTDDAAGLPRHPGFLWLTREEIRSCLQHAHLVNSEARTLVLYIDLVEGGSVGRWSDC